MLSLFLFTSRPWCTRSFVHLHVYVCIHQQKHGALDHLCTCICLHTPAEAWCTRSFVHLYLSPPAESWYTRSFVHQQNHGTLDHFPTFHMYLFVSTSRTRLFVHLPPVSVCVHQQNHGTLDHLSTFHLNLCHHEKHGILDLDHLSTCVFQQKNDELDHLISHTYPTVKVWCMLIACLCPPKTSWCTNLNIVMLTSGNDAVDYLFT